MAGYHNYSMSNNALAAYAAGKMPLSKWTKSAILETAAEYLDGDETAAAKLTLLRKCKLRILKSKLLRQTEWHHTSSHYNITDFFGIDEDTLEELTAETVAEWHEDETPAPVSQKRPGTIDYIEWGGTRKHPKAHERTLENVEIEEKGSFYLVYKDGSLVLKKKIGSNGTFVRYSC